MSTKVTLGVHTTGQRLILTPWIIDEPAVLETYILTCVSGHSNHLCIKCEQPVIHCSSSRTSNTVMEHPPGLVYLFRRLHFFLLPPIAVYLAFNLGKQYLGLCIPTWIIVVSTLLARPALSFGHNQYKDLNDKRAAAALGAVLPPHVQESSFTVARKAVNSLDGFPGLPSFSMLALPTTISV